MSPPPVPDDLRHDTTLFGRNDELYDLVHLLRQGRHVLLTGEKGIGKSRLMLEARWLLSGRSKRIDFSPAVITHVREMPGVHIEPGAWKTLTVGQITPLGACLTEMAEKLYRNGDLRLDVGEERDDWEIVKKKFSRLAGAGRQDLIAEALTGKHYILFLDSLDRLSPAQQPFVEMLLNIGVVCAAVVRPREHALLRRAWASFSRIELAALPEPACAAFVDYVLQHYPLRVDDHALYKSELLKTSNGNPFHMKNLLWRGLRESYVDAAEIRRLRQVEEGSYFNMGPVYIFGVALFTVYKV